MTIVEGFYVVTMLAGAAVVVVGTSIFFLRFR
jgi:hypothetical protein